MMPDDGFRPYNPLFDDWRKLKFWTSRIKLFYIKLNKLWLWIGIDVLLILILVMGYILLIWRIYGDLK